jgi:CRP-like cAMP-binding protein
MNNLPSVMPTIHFNPGQIIFREGDTADGGVSDLRRQR